MYFTISRLETRCSQILADLFLFLCQTCLIFWIFQFNLLKRFFFVQVGLKSVPMFERALKKQNQFPIIKSNWLNDCKLISGTNEETSIKSFERTALSLKSWFWRFLKLNYQRISIIETDAKLVLSETNRKGTRCHRVDGNLYQQSAIKFFIRLFVLQKQLIFGRKFQFFYRSQITQPRGGLCPEIVG